MLPALPLSVPISLDECTSSRSCRGSLSLALGRGAIPLGGEDKDAAGALRGAAAAWARCRWRQEHASASWEPSWTTAVHEACSGLISDGGNGVWAAWKPVAAQRPWTWEAQGACSMYDSRPRCMYCGGVRDAADCVKWEAVLGADGAPSWQGWTVAMSMAHRNRQRVQLAHTAGAARLGSV